MSSATIFIIFIFSLTFAAPLVALLFSYILLQRDRRKIEDSQRAYHAKRDLLLLLMAIGVIKRNDIRDNGQHRNGGIGPGRT